MAPDGAIRYANQAFGAGETSFSKKQTFDMD